MPSRRTVVRRSIRRKSGGVDLASDVNVVMSVNTPDSTRSAEDMTEDKGNKGLTDAELEEQDGEELPDREQMSLVNANLAAPVNAAVALNALSDGSVAVADATQSADITQTN